MNTLVDNAIYAATNPIESVSKFASSPIGTLSSVVGMSINAVQDTMRDPVQTVVDIKNDAMQNITGYSIASLLVLYVFYAGFRVPLDLDRFI